jgi:hypothetical protein
MTVPPPLPSVFPVARASASVAPSQGAGGSTSAAPPSLSDATILSCSTPAQLMSKMRQLAVTNPEEFKLLAAEMGTRFQTVASQSTGQDAQLFAKVSAQFQQAAQSGVLDPTDASAKTDSKGATAVTSTAAANGTGPSGDPDRSGNAYARDRGTLTRASWQSPGVQQAFTDALDVFTTRAQSSPQPPST